MVFSSTAFYHKLQVHTDEVTHVSVLMDSCPYPTGQDFSLPSCTWRYREAFHPRLLNLMD